ncbi:putative GNAT family acetyltransferase [Actinoplanes campanulatus]|uniref:Putative GNAT family acetyltransferase n=1 Tax=Actinoplanes campanulatus TaxID=113559 RepID=A0A7W5AKL7_9ACTN|nr:GNAT family N-acetyltransferase [Actinoplanes campanulatus]MBB3097820.1 putative GNAT family acetyltransferase [Actinoplanes campanulatus]GGN38494.1 N-acetyltransferase [Actinoplanes campanulatus]GID39611.1 N-acetyltransferase [Actinoplanes campanulatus]
MRSDDWHLTEDVNDFLTRAGAFLRSRPTHHTMALTATEKLRTRQGGTDGVVFGRLETDGEVRAIFYGAPSRALNVTCLTPEQADVLAGQIVALGHCHSSVTSDHSTATAFAEAWRRHTGATPTLRSRLHLYRLGALTPPAKAPPGRGRFAGEQDHERLMRWCQEFTADVGEIGSINAASWAGTRFADKSYTFWETPDGTPVSMAGLNPMVAGQVRVDPVYTPPSLRGRGYAGAVTVEVSRAALAAGATDVVLFTDAANPTSNALYQGLGYRPVTDWAVYGFAYART